MYGTPYADFVAYGGEQGAKDAGRMRLKGADYACSGRRHHVLPLSMYKARHLNGISQVI